jgi:hypothetical protein
MREELIAGLAKSLSSISSERNEVKRLQATDRFVIRLEAVSHWLDGGIMIARWIHLLQAHVEVDVVLNELKLRLESPPNPILLYFSSALPAGPSVSLDTLPALLNEAVKEGIPLSRDPPWPIQDAPIVTSSFSENLRLVVCQVTLEEVSTEQLFASLKETFAAVVSRGFARPKIWILPTVSRNRLLVLLGESEALRDILKEVLSHLIHLVDV